MNNFLGFSRKIRIPIKGDGHCLPRAVFRGAKYLGLLVEFTTYSQLLRACVDDIKTNIDDYKSYNIQGEKAALEALKEYVESKLYNSNQNIIDAVIVALARKTQCTITVHYQKDDVGFYQHDYHPGDEVPKG